uniref:Uncharacterized protein n=1 Tax=Moniliophthora roreri TaxID=221103 RepID=A0A0W0FIE8_MONRR
MNIECLGSGSSGKTTDRQFCSAPAKLALPPYRNNQNYGSALFEVEEFWVKRVVWLESVGYRLRPRYQPGWVPKLETISEKLRSPLTTYIVWRLDCIAKEELADHPRNHCAPIYDVLSVPNDTNLDVIVMPLLRLFDESQFDTVGEVIHFLHQIFEVMAFNLCMNITPRMDNTPFRPVILRSP